MPDKPPANGTLDAAIQASALRWIGRLAVVAIVGAVGFAASEWGRPLPGGSSGEMLLAIRENTSTMRYNTQELKQLRGDLLELQRQNRDMLVLIARWHEPVSRQKDHSRSND